MLRNTEACVFTLSDHGAPRYPTCWWLWSQGLSNLDKQMPPPHTRGLKISFLVCVPRGERNSGCCSVPCPLPVCAPSSLCPPSSPSLFPPQSWMGVFSQNNWSIPSTQESSRRVLVHTRNLGISSRHVRTTHRLPELYTSLLAELAAGDPRCWP